MKVMVTGSFGFIGTNLVLRLLRDEYEVIGVDNFRAMYSRSIQQRNLEEQIRASTPTQFRFYTCDLTNSYTLYEILVRERPDAVVHLAAMSGVRQSWKNPGVFRDNVWATYNLIEAIRKLKASNPTSDPVHRLIAASSSSVYAPADISLGMAAIESDTLRPTSPYAASKAVMEAVVAYYAPLAEVEYCIVRPFSVYGPFFRPDQIVGRAIALWTAGEPLPLYGRHVLRNRRDFTYVDDVVDGIVRLLQAESGWLPSIVNLASGTPTPIRVALEKVAKFMGVEPRYDIRETAMPNDIYATWGLTETAESFLEWSPKVDLDTGLTETIRWWRALPEDWRQEIITNARRDQ